MGYYLYYSWVNDAFRLALVQEIPKHEYNDLFNSGEKNQEAFKELGYDLPNVDFKDTRKNVRQFGEGENIVDESTGESIPIQRHELHRSPIGESPWRKEGNNDETGTQEGETIEVSEESEE